MTGRLTVVHEAISSGLQVQYFGGNLVAGHMLVETLVLIQQLQESSVCQRGEQQLRQKHTGGKSSGRRSGSQARNTDPLLE